MANRNAYTASSMESKAELEAALQEIRKWENNQKDLWFWEKLGRLPFMLLDKITPRFIQEKLGAAMDELGGYIQNGGRYLISEKSIASLLADHARGSGAEGLPAYPLAVMDRTAEQLAASRAKLAAIQGASTGIGGLFTLAVDIPAVLGLSLKIIQEIAICYGFDPKEKEERIFAVKVMQFASSDIVGKRAIIEELAAIGSADEDKRQRAMISQLQGWREVVAVFRDNFGWKKLFQLVPVAGMIFGALINKGMLQDMAEAAQMLYRKRRILIRLAESGEQHDKHERLERTT
ncbi:EcsC family protein [Paenibacillus beijingensis]|uniref:EcsC family protein n=1 Tax=Paenibacillus beijingensis TaxID=1126833 RepID=A0A0D5NNW4_9BACL|nr:hypothetical protein VN24_21540 [Paenibacillus beijingensis]